MKVLADECCPLTEHAESFEKSLNIPNLFYHKSSPLNKILMVFYIVSDKNIVFALNVRAYLNDLNIFLNED